MRVLVAVWTILAFLMTFAEPASAQGQCPEGNVRSCWYEEGYNDGSAQIVPYSNGAVYWVAEEGYWLLGGCVEVTNGESKIIIYDESHVHDRSWLLEGPWGPLSSFCAVGYTELIPQPPEPTPVPTIQPEEEFVPEPATGVLLVAGLASLLGWTKLRRG